MGYHEQFAAEAMIAFEEFYDIEFLPKMGAVDSPFARASYYATMIEITDTQLDYPSKDAVLQELRKRYNQAIEEIRKLHRDLMP